MTELGPDRFADFYEAVNGYPPFPWQAALLRKVVADQAWPEVLDLPTGSGKTSTIDIAVFALACAAAEDPAAVWAPRRVVMVVDRRVVVDQAANHGRALTRALADASDRTVRHVADSLRSLCGTEVPLLSATLRGGMVSDDTWTRHPDQPAVLSSTVDQVGSRLLFRGYGVSPGMRPVHAGLLGSDCLYLLDEVHLARPFAQSLAAVGSYREWAEEHLDAAPMFTR